MTVYQSCSHFVPTLQLVKHSLRRITNAAARTSVKCAICGTSHAVWCCLQCYQVGCGRHEQKHALKHSQKSGHHICVNMKSPEQLWCYKCDKHIVCFATDSNETKELERRRQYEKDKIQRLQDNEPLQDCALNMKWVNLSLKQYVFETKTIDPEETLLVQQEIDELMTQKNDYFEQVNRYKGNEAKWTQKLKEYQHENGRLMEECKELKLELAQTQNELNKVKRLNPTHYLEWSSDEVVDWLVNLERGRFKKYEQRLRVIFNKEGVTGQGMKYINPSEMRGWGIESFMDRGIINKHIDNLINKNKNNNNDDDEGSNNYNGTEYGM